MEGRKTLDAAGDNFLFARPPSAIDGQRQRYVGKVFACAFLAPDIVEAILEGRQPRDLNFEKLCKHIPLSWAEQRKQFGLPQNVMLQADTGRP